MFLKNNCDSLHVVLHHIKQQNCPPRNKAISLNNKTQCVHKSGSYSKHVTVRVVERRTKDRAVRRHKQLARRPYWAAIVNNSRGVTSEFGKYFCLISTTFVY